jgi:hypothetical protein
MDDARKKELKALMNKASFTGQKQRARVVKEIRRRSQETLTLYKPLEMQELFHRSEAPERIYRGPNRMGKTTCGMMEVGWAATGTHPWLDYPKRNGIIYIVAKDERHIGNVFYRKLFRAGAIFMIPDEVSGEWRAYDPDADKDRENEKRPAPPVIPTRMLKGGLKAFSWRVRKDNVFTKVTLVNGWEIHAFPSGGPPPQGTDVDFVLMDEHIVHPDWYFELSRGLVDRGGRFCWTATPQSDNPQLYDLSQKAEEEAKKELPEVVEFVPPPESNFHIPQEQMDRWKDKLKDNPEQYAVRIMGDFAIRGGLMYPGYHQSTHALNPEALPPAGIAEDWARFAVIDPGHTCCAVLFAAVPPPGNPLGDIVLLYKELYLRSCDAETFGVEFEDAVGADTMQSFIIDMHGARLTNSGDGLQPLYHYTKQLEKRRLNCMDTGTEFQAGSDDTSYRRECVRAWIRGRGSGKGAKLRVLWDYMYHFNNEINKYNKQKDARTGQITEKPNSKRNTHLMECLEMLAAFDPQWESPRINAAKVSPVKARFDKLMKQEREKNREGTDVINFY